MRVRQDAELAAALRNMLAPEDLLIGVDDRRCYSSDLYSEGALCAAVVRPRNVSCLAEIVAVATSAGYAIIPRGGATTHTGGCTPETDASLVVDTTGLNRILSVSEEDMVVKVEAGVTWKQADEALAAKSLRLPFFGPFSGARATIGGSLSTGATYLGGARYGSAADLVLDLSVVLSDGSVLHTGHAAAARATKPVYRAYGPDLTGLFVHDQGALGVKAEASLRLIRRPESTGFLSFAFPSLQSAAAAVCEVGRSGAAEEAYVIDPSVARARLAQRSLGNDLAALKHVMARERTWVRGLSPAASLLATGGRFLAADAFSLQIVCAGRSRAAVRSDMRACRDIARRRDGREIPSTAPRGNRANPFPPITTATGRNDGRWAAVNAKIAHSDALQLIAAAEAMLAPHREAMQALGVETSLQLYAVSHHVFHYECMIWWPDAWLPLHRRGAAIYAAAVSEPPSSPEARDLAGTLRQDLLDLFHRFGAASNQLGKAYNYVDTLRPEPSSVLAGLKRQLDPQGLMNPGALGLRGPIATEPRPPWLASG